MKFRLLTTVLFGVMLLNVGLFAQTDEDDPLKGKGKTQPHFIGPVAGFNSITHSVKQLATFTGDVKCPYYENGTGKGFYVGFSYEYHIGKFEESTSSVIARAIFSMMPGSMEVAGDQYPSMIKATDSTVNIIQSVTKHTMDISYNVASVEVMYKLNFQKSLPIGITVGPTFDFPITKTVTRKYKIVSPSNVQWSQQPGYQYEDNGQTLILENGPIKDALGFRLGFKVGLQYEILFKKFYLVPAIYYNFGITKVNSNDNWRVNALQIGCDLRFGI